MTLRVTEAFPERDRDFDAVVRGKLEQVGERVGSHGVMVTRLERARKIRCGLPDIRQSIPVFASIRGLTSPIELSYQMSGKTIADFILRCAIRN